MAKLKKVISGGQTGVDQAALRAAQKRGLTCGGWCPPRRMCEAGTIPSHLPLKETPKEHSHLAPKVPRSQRTEWNVRDSDGTLILQPLHIERDDPGTKWTGQCAARYGRPLLVCDPADPSAPDVIKQWLTALPIQTLNVAGPSEGTVPGIGDQAYALLTQVFSSNGASPIVEPPEAPVTQKEHTEIQTQPLPWWMGFPLSFVRQRRLALVYIAITFTLTLLLLVISLFIAFQYFGLRIVAGQIYLGSAPPTVGAQATVDATAGFQNSGIKLRKGQKIVLRPEGRIHIAMDHANNLTQAVKGIIVNNTPEKGFSDHLRERYPLPSLDESSVFYRDWSGPEGEATYSDLLEDCKLRKELGWGALLAVVLPNQVSARADPYDVLKSNGLSSLDLIPVPSETTIIAERDGWLTFIINEAVISPASPSKDSQIYYGTLKRTAESLTGDPRHRIPLQSIPLIWFADNNGAFRVAATCDLTER
jgi:hypothetical protein